MQGAPRVSLLIPISMHALQPALILLAMAVLVVVLFRSLKLPPLLGYLIVGVAIGPHALALIEGGEEVRVLGEIGVVFLMFSIGLEFSLPKLVTMRRTVFGLGAAQVVLTMVVVIVAALALGVDWRAAIVLGGALAMSSTAILAKLLAERLELNAPHGRRIMGILLFQDLAVVPLLILVPALTAQPERIVIDLGHAVLKAAVVLSVLLYAGQRVMRAWFHVVARQKSSELFVLNVLLVTLGIAFLTELAGLSLALGAFLAGALISETEYRYQVEEDIKPFRDVLLGLFFVTIGMLLDLRVVAANASASALLVALVLFKALLIFGLVRLSRADTGVAIRTGLALSACGEFGFVILAHAHHAELLAPAVLQPVLAAMVLSMLIAPFIVERSEFLARRLSSGEWLNQARQVHDIAVRSMAAHRHVIICGYGRTGQNLARFLDREQVSFIALDNDPLRIREAVAAGESVVFGDAARREVLVAAGLMRARAVAITYANTASALAILAHVQQVWPDVPVVVRTLDDADIERLKAAGAAEVVAEVMEGSLMLASSTLMLLGVPLTRVLRRIRDTREHRYALFRGFFRGATDETEDRDEALLPRLHSVVLAPGSGGVGRRLEDLGLERLGVEVTAIRRRNVRTVTPAPETRLEESDVVVVRGSEEAVTAAEMKLLQG